MNKLLLVLFTVLISQNKYGQEVLANDIIHRSDKILSLRDEYFKEWNSTNFITHGITLNDSLKNKDVYVSMLRLVENDSLKVKELYLSSKDEPVKQLVSNGEFYYKIVPTMNSTTNFTRTRSPYYITKEQLNLFKSFDATYVLEDKLALPLASYSLAYHVYKIECIDAGGCEIFVSTVADSEQYLKSTDHKRHFNSGGATQILILDTTNQQKWSKDTTAIETILPLYSPEA